MAQPDNGMASSRKLIVSSAHRPTSYTMSSPELHMAPVASLRNLFEVAALGECPLAETHAAAERAILLRQTVWSVIVPAAALLMR